MFNGFQKPQVVFDYVNGIEGARAYQLPPTYKALLMDMNKPMFYWKEYSTQTGQASLVTYTFAEYKEPEPPKPLTREDIESIVKELMGKKEIKDESVV